MTRSLTASMQVTWRLPKLDVLPHARKHGEGSLSVLLPRSVA